MQSTFERGRLDQADYVENFQELHPPLDQHEAKIEADRCYFCHDAPCMQACPTSIDIPLFIRQISTGNPKGSAKTIFDSNILGGMCARVCPTETLCEEVCVREVAEGKPVRIGELQTLCHRPFDRRRTSIPTNAQLRLASGWRLSALDQRALPVPTNSLRLGHSITLFDERKKLGGLNEHGIASYKTVDNFAAREVDFVLSIGGIEVRTETKLGRDMQLEELKKAFDAVFLGLGLGGVNRLDNEGMALEGVIDAVSYIEQIRQADDLASLEDRQANCRHRRRHDRYRHCHSSKLLGAEEVTIAYRRGQERMNASAFEQDLAQTRGVSIRTHLQPVRAVIGMMATFEVSSWNIPKMVKMGLLAPAKRSFFLPTCCFWRSAKPMLAILAGICKCAVDGSKPTISAAPAILKSGLAAIASLVAKISLLPLLKTARSLHNRFTPR